MFDGLPGNTSARCADLAGLPARSCRGEQRSSRPTDEGDNAASGRHAIPCWRCTPRRSIASAAESAIAAPHASATVDPLTGETAEFWAAERALPRRQAQAVALYYFQDLSVQQTARVLDCAEGTVKAHLAKARRALARQLELEMAEDQ